VTIKNCFVSVAGTALLAISVMAQTPGTQTSQGSATELPSAPSAVAMPKQPEPAKPAPKDNNSAQPAADTRPVLRSLGQKAPTNPAPSDSAQDSLLPPPDPPDNAPKTRNSASAAEKSVDDDKIEVVRKNVDEVNVTFTVTDKHGHF